MSKPMKQMMTQEYESLYDGVEGACVVELTGMDAQNTHAFRGMLRERSMKLRVLKNRIARRAFIDGPLAPLGGRLEGPCALVVGESVIETAKALVEAAKRFPALTLKDGLIEGETELTPVKELAGMKSLGELQADLMALALSPGRNLAGALLGGGGKIAACIKTIIDKLEKGEPVGQAA
jgi:large subunit ribosomal protein L10